jgi:hypothetical protein
MTENEEDKVTGSPEEGEHMSSPGEGYPAGETEPHGDDVPDASHPEDIGSTPSDEPDEDVTESPGGPADPDTGAD